MPQSIELPGSNDIWYAKDGKDNDVIVSTRVRLARNLANFIFPVESDKQKNNENTISDSQRIQSIIIDAFNKFDDCDRYKAVKIDNIESTGIHLLEEQGLVKLSNNQNIGLIIKDDCRTSCTVNSVDHVRIASFSSGMDIDGTLSRCHEIDEKIQKNVQFAASYDFGYLTSSIFDTGTGMKISLRVHLPSLVFENAIPSIVSDMLERNVSITSCFDSIQEGINSSRDLSTFISRKLSSNNLGNSLGSYYQICGTNCFSGNEYDQVATVAAAGQLLVNMERKARIECKNKNLTEIKDKVYRAYALARFSKFISLRESFEIISGIKWGLDLELLSGIQESELNALLFRVQESHLQLLLEEGNFNFEKDIADNIKMKIYRLRALLLQEECQNIILQEITQ